MTEENRDHYRIDPAKVQQKIYDMYPANSLARKQMLDEAKQKELDRLNDTLNAFPFELTNLLLETSLKRGRAALGKAILWFLGTAGFFGFTFLTSTNLEAILLGGLGGVCFLFMLDTLVHATQELLAARKLSKAVSSMIEKVENLKKKANL